MFVIFLLGFQKTIAGCPKVTCGDYSSHLCAVFEDDSIEISPCLGPDICDISNLYSDWLQGNTGHACSSPQIDPQSDSIYDLMSLTCSYSPDTGKKLIGSHPKKCNSNNDCELIDGSFSECNCGLSQNGYSYCKVSEGDEEALKMHESACAKKIDLFVWHLLRSEFYVFLHDRPICAGFVFEDLAAIDYLYAGGSILRVVSEYSGAVGYGLLTILFVI